MFIKVRYPGRAPMYGNVVSISTDFQNLHVTVSNNVVGKDFPLFYRLGSSIDMKTTFSVHWSASRVSYP